MKGLAILFALLGVVTGTAGALENIGSVGRGRGVVLPSTRSNPCFPALLYTSYDATAENAYCWQGGGILPPYYGAFAECIDFGSGADICGFDFVFTSVGQPCDVLTAYVWDDAGGVPGNVLSMTPGLNPCPNIAIWPEYSNYDPAITPVWVCGVTWFGYWADWANRPCGYFVAADTNGFGGCPYTNIAPGIGYPTGWNNVGVVWGPTQSLGIGAFATDHPNNPACDGVPVKESTWGVIKHLYN